MSSQADVRRAGEVSGAAGVRGGRAGLRGSRRSDDQRHEKSEENQKDKVLALRTEDRSMKLPCPLSFRDPLQLVCFRVEARPA